MIQREASVLTLTRHHLLKQLVSTTRQVSGDPEHKAGLMFRQEGELWLKTEDKPSQQPLGRPDPSGPLVSPSERPQLTASPPRPQEGPATVYRQQAIDFGSLPLSPSQKPINHACTCSPFKDGYYLSALWQSFGISIQAQMEDKGVGLIDQAAPAPYVRLAKWLVSQMRRPLAHQSPVIKPGH